MNLDIRGLSKTYPNGTHALRGVSLAIPTGMFGLLGPNGAGKSTLMRILATLQEADSGAVTLGEIDVLRQKEQLRQVLGYLPQEFGVYPKVSAEELLDHFALLKGMTDRRRRRETVGHLLHQTNLWEARTKKLGGFSGGMRQRFGIAVALLGNPRLIIVDEPTAGLDPAERVRFLNLLSELGENAVVILSTHIVEDVSELCSRMAIIDRGQILLEAEPLAATERLRGRVWRRIVDRAELSDFELRFQVISTRLLSGRTVARVVADAAPDPSFSPVEPDLEDVYFATMRRISLDTPRSPAIEVHPGGGGGSGLVELDELAGPGEPAHAGSLLAPAQPAEVAATGGSAPREPAYGVALETVATTIDALAVPSPDDGRAGPANDPTESHLDAPHLDGPHLDGSHAATIHPAEADLHAARPDATPSRAAHSDSVRADAVGYDGTQPDPGGAHGAPSPAVDLPPGGEEAGAARRLPSAPLPSAPPAAGTANTPFWDNARLEHGRADPPADPRLHPADGSRRQGDGTDAGPA